MTEETITKSSSSAPISPWFDPSYVQTRRSPITMEDCLGENPTFEMGCDGLPYAVFPDNLYSFEYAEFLHGPFPEAVIANFGSYENAVILQKSIGL